MAAAGSRETEAGSYAASIRGKALPDLAISEHLPTIVQREGGSVAHPHARRKKKDRPAWTLADLSFLIPSSSPLTGEAAMISGFRCSYFAGA